MKQVFKSVPIPLNYKPICLWYQLLKKGAKLSEVQLEQQFDRPNFVFPQVHHLDW